MSDVEVLSEPLRSNANLSGDYTMKGSITWDRNAATGEKQPATATSNAASNGTPLAEEQFKLVDLDISFPKGKMTLVAGKFGSGKTLLLLGLLGEAHLIKGEISYALSHLLPPNLNEYVPADWSWDIVTGSVAYAPQTTWLLSASIRWDGTPRAADDVGTTFCSAFP